MARAGASGWCCGRRLRPRARRPPPPEETAVAGEQHRLLLEALEELADGQRLVLACRYLLALSEEETAAALGVRRGTVKSRTARALAQLREVYGARV